MKNLPLISIIIPTYKRSDKIERAIDSSLNQTYSNIEVIVVDDNDVNSSYRMITETKMKKYSGNEKVKYIKHKMNTGGSIARNTGIRESRGDFVAFLDDDDYFDYDKIRLQLEEFYRVSNGIDPNISLIYCDMIGEDKNGCEKWISSNNLSGLPLFESMTSCIATTSTWLCKRKALIDVGGFVDVPAKQDVLVMMLLIANGYSISYVSQRLVRYSAENDNRISTNTSKQVAGIKTFMNHARNYYSLLDENQIKKVEYHNALLLFRHYYVLKDNSNMKNQLSVIFKYGKDRAKYRMLIKYIFSCLYGLVKFEHDESV